MRRVMSERVRTTPILGVTHAKNANASSKLCVLCLPPEIIAEVLTCLRDLTSVLMTLMLTSVGFHDAVAAFVASAHAEQQQLLPWCRGVSCKRHLAIELALAALHFLRRSHMHGFMPTPSYSAVRQALLAEHTRCGIELVSLIEHSGRVDPAWPSPPPSGCVVDPAALAANPFLNNRPGDDVSWCTCCPDDREVMIAVRDAARCAAAGVFVGDVLLAAVRIPYGVCAWWMESGAIALYAKKFREHRFVLKHKVPDSWDT
jgi:hypothetical protein